jgi:penicillin-binding protein 2
VAATPIQMANVVATFARDGVWQRPTLLDAPGYVIPGSEKLGPARVDLHLPPDAVRAAKEGMVRVVNSRAGTGPWVQRPDVLIAGKTGTAQAAPLSLIVRDAAGKPVRDKDGRPQREVIEPSTLEHANPRAPWYLATGTDNKDLNHAWYTGFAPARNPKVAFAVMIEYGVSGGNTAGGVAKAVIDACVKRNYLPLDTTPLEPAGAATASQTADAGGELMHDAAR